MTSKRWLWEVYADEDLAAHGYAEGERNRVLLEVSKRVPSMLDDFGIQAKASRVEVFEINTQEG